MHQQSVLHRRAHKCTFSVSQEARRIDAGVTRRLCHQPAALPAQIEHTGPPPPRQIAG